MDSDAGPTAELILAAEDDLAIMLEPAERTVLEDLVARRSTGLDDGTLRAQFLQWMLTAEATRGLTANRVLRITGGRVTDDLDLRGVTIPCVLLFRRVHFSGDLLLTGAKTSSLLLRGCSGGLLGLEEATIDGTMRVATGDDDERSVFEAIALADATVVRNVEIVGADLDPGWRRDHDEGWEYPAGVDLTRATVHGSLAVVRGASVRGGLVAVDCHVHGNASLVDAHFEADNPGAEALSLLRARIDGSLFLHRPVSRPGDGGTTTRYTSCFGAVVLARTRIAGDVNLNGLQITTPRTGTGAAVESAEPVDTAEDEPPTPESGRTGGRWWGLDLVGAAVGGSVWLNDVAVEGFGVRLTNTTVGGDLECDGTFITPSPDLPEGTRSAQRSEHAGAEEMVANVPDRAHYEMVAARIEKVFRWDVIWPRGTRPVIDLTDSTVRTFDYASTLGWTEHCYLAGFSFDRIVASYLPFRHRRLANVVKKVLGWRPNETPRGRPQRWLHRRVFAPDRTHLDWLRCYTRSSFEPWLYTMLATALERHGQHAEAERVLMARTNDGNRAQGWPRRVLGVPYRVFVGNGYRPQRAMLWAVLLTAVGAIAFAGAYRGGQLVPVDPTAVAQPFNAVVYSADTLLPIVDLHQARTYEVASEDAGWVRALLWSMIGLGWAIATSLASAAASYIRRAH